MEDQAEGPCREAESATSILSKIWTMKTDIFLRNKISCTAEGLGMLVCANLDSWWERGWAGGGVRVGEKFSENS